MISRFRFGSAAEVALLPSIADDDLTIVDLDRILMGRQG
jgi:hypothetical protein